MYVSHLISRPHLSHRISPTTSPALQLIQRISPIVYKSHYTPSNACASLAIRHFVVRQFRTRVENRKSIVATTTSADRWGEEAKLRGKGMDGTSNALGGWTETVVVAGGDNKRRRC